MHLESEPQSLIWLDGLTWMPESKRETSLLRSITLCFDEADFKVDLKRLHTLSEFLNAFFIIIVLVLPY